MRTVVCALVIAPFVIAAYEAQVLPQAAVVILATAVRRVPGVSVMLT